MQFSSDTNSFESVSDSTGLRAHFLKTALIPDAPYQFHIPGQSYTQPTWLQIWRFLWFPFLILNLLEWLTELRKTLYQFFFYKGCNSGTEWQKTSIGQSIQVWMRRASLCSVGVPPPRIPVCSPAWKPSELSHLRAFREASLGGHDWLDHWPLVIELLSRPSPLSSFSWGLGAVLKVPRF